MHRDEFLQRRSDLSTFVVHLTRDRQNATAREALHSIVRDRRLIAGNKRGWAQAAGPVAGDSQRVVCFSEAPLEHVYSLTIDLEGQQINLRPYGVALTKTTARRKGINPVWYVNADDQGGVAPSLDQLLATCRDDGFLEHPAARLFPFIEPIGPGRDFSWEREWRSVGDVSLEPQDIAFWLCPEDEIEQFEAFVMSDWELGGGTRTQQLADQQYAIDPRWGVEKAIHHLARAGTPQTFDDRPPIGD